MKNIDNLKIYLVKTREEVLPKRKELLVKVFDQGEFIGYRRKLYNKRELYPVENYKGFRMKLRKFVKDEAIYELIH